MTITPAMIPAERHQIQDALLALGYTVAGGGTATNMSYCDISFTRKGGDKKMAKQKKPATPNIFKAPKVKKAPVVTKKPAKKKK